MTQESSMLKSLDGLGIAWIMHEHCAVFTVDESIELHHSIAGEHTKNMFLKDSGGYFWLVTVPHEVRVDLKALPAVIGSKKLSFGKAEDLARLLGITPGAVTPLAAFNDGDGAVNVVLDAALGAAEIVNVHPLRNTATLSLSGSALIEALKSWNHTPAIINVPVVP
jgi:Ala-tRNA(Pro) deacylase